MKAFTKVLTYFIFPVIIIALGYFVVDSILQPVRFKKEVKARETVAIDRLKSIRTLQVSYKTKYGRYASTADSLIDFYRNGTITVVRQIGSMDDSVAVAQKLVRRDSINIAVKDTLLNDKPNFVIDSIKYIPFSGGEEVIWQSVVKVVSGVNVPLFEVDVPYDLLLKGLDAQSIINKKAEKEDMGRYAGIMVGSVTNPNNNAGNWE